MSGRSFGVFDAIEGGIASGWAYNPFDPATPVTVDFYVEDQIIHSVVADLDRPDVTGANRTGMKCGFRTFIQISRQFSGEIDVHAKIREADWALDNSPRRFVLPAKVQKWLRNRRRPAGLSAERLRRRLNRQVAGQRIAIVIPFYNSRPDWIHDAVASVRAQGCDSWQLICVDDGSSDAHVAESLLAYAALDKRIKYIRNPRNLGIAFSMNVGIKNCDADMIAFMDHDDYIEPDAVYHYLRAAKTGADLIYCDEMITGEKLDDIRLVAARPAFSYEYYLQHPYFVHMICIKRTVLETVGGWDEGLIVSADVDLILRVLEQANSVAHIAKVLYRWRTHSGSSGHHSKPAVMTATSQAIRRHLHRKGEGGRVEPRAQFNHFSIEYPRCDGTVLIVIPTKNGVAFLRRCIDSIERTTPKDQVKICVVDHSSDEAATLAYLREISGRVHILQAYGDFNYSRINNDAVRAMRDGCEFVLFLNNDIEVIKAGWLDRLKSFAGRERIGIVGATLLYGSGAIQHSGVIIGINGLADHAHRGLPYLAGDVVEPGYLSSIVSVRDYSAVTGACLLMRLSVFDAVQGFDERLKIAFNDTDLCLRVSARGLRIVNVSDVVLFHYESQTRRQSKKLMEHSEDSELFKTKWRQFIRDGDPFYNPILSLRGRDHELTFSGVDWHNVGAIRVVDLV